MKTPVMSINLIVFFLFLGLGFVIFSVDVMGEEYRIGFGDILEISVWTWGVEHLQQQQVTVDTDGKISLTFHAIRGDSYRLGPGDVITIDVWGYPELQSSQLIIRPDGNITLPLIGEVNATAKTVSEFAATLTTELSEYLKNPLVVVDVDKFKTIPVVDEIVARDMTLMELTGEISAIFSQYVLDAKVAVNILKYGTTRVFVLGEVGKPGLYEIEREHRVMDALSAAGGFTKGASKRKVYLVRGNQSGEYLEINLNRILKKGDLTQNYLMNNGDILYLARNGLDFVKEILPFIQSAYYLHNM